MATTSRKRKNRAGSAPPRNLAWACAAFAKAFRTEANVEAGNGKVELAGARSIWVKGLAFALAFC
jgi:hypothetical protein